MATKTTNTRVQITLDKRQVQLLDEAGVRKSQLVQELLNEYLRKGLRA